MLVDYAGGLHRASTKHLQVWPFQRTDERPLKRLRTNGFVGYGLQSTSDGLQPNSDGFQPNSDVCIYLYVCMYIYIYVTYLYTHGIDKYT